MPGHVHVMALTATASKKTRQQIIRIIGMVRPFIILQSPDRPNISYGVETPAKMEDTFTALAEELKRCRETTDRTIIFCRTHEDCAHIYIYLKRYLGKESIDPIGAPDLARFRLVDMFSSCTQKTIKETILAGFCNPNGKLRVVVATVAFGMGIDCPNVRRIYTGVLLRILNYICKRLDELEETGIDRKPSFIVYHQQPIDLSKKT